MNPLQILIVDDEAPARQRLRDVLGDLVASHPHQIIGESEDGLAALEFCEQHPVDLVLTDIRMPRMDGLELAQHLAHLPRPPGVIFATAYDQHAIDAFELAAIDYLLKPVRASRLETALGKAQTLVLRNEQLQQLAPQGRSMLRSVERGRSLLVPVSEILYLRAELKYVTARTAEREYLLDESLNQLEQELGELFVRVHRNCLVARKDLLGYERAPESAGEAQWQILLKGTEERIPVSRRQWAHVKGLFKA